ncbi:MAG: galactokinase, partial [Planctomycetes bacterium]|nr:galactokinase [Planctomycetota bacterium]
HWSNYPMTVARRIARNFPEARRGADLAFSSDLPPAAGMSSSSAMMVAVFLALADVNHLTENPRFQENVANLTDLAGYLGTVENGQTFGSLEGDRGVGTFGGSEDHTAMLCARPNHVSQYAYCPVRFDRAIPLPADHTFAVASSGVAAEKTGAAMEKYNTASRLASAVAERWRRETGRDDPHLAAVLASGPEAVERLRDVVLEAKAEPLLKRLDHFLAENEEILPGAGDALAQGDVAEFGRLVDRSQGAAEELLGNQIPQTSFLARSARACGAAAASGFGAGFGGSVWALVEKSRIEPLLAAWDEAYRAEFPQNAREALFFTTAAGPAAFQVC